MEGEIFLRSAARAISPQFTPKNRKSFMPLTFGLLTSFPIKKFDHRQTQLISPMSLLIAAMSGLKIFPPIQKAPPRNRLIVAIRALKPAL
jgi:hypothetical protein